MRQLRRMHRQRRTPPAPRPRGGAGAAAGSRSAARRASRARARARTRSGRPPRDPRRSAAPRTAASSDASSSSSLWSGATACSVGEAEVAAQHGGQRERLERRRRQPVQAPADDVLDALRHDAAPASWRRAVQQLLDEERVAAGLLAQPLRAARRRPSRGRGARPTSAAVSDESQAGRGGSSRCRARAAGRRARGSAGRPRPPPGRCTSRQRATASRRRGARAGAAAAASGRPPSAGPRGRAAAAAARGVQQQPDKRVEQLVAGALTRSSVADDLRCTAEPSSGTSRASSCATAAASPVSSASPGRCAA